MSVSGEAILSGRRLHVRFFYGNDRYGHVISLVRGDDVCPLLESLEGSKEDDWPPSPALQSLHVERRDDAQLALLVGMAGRSHWSVVVELATREHEEVLTFDVACRVQSPADFLGSCYRLASKVRIEEAGKVVLPGGACQLSVPSEGANRTAWSNVEGKVAFTPHAQSDPPPTTRRWTYALLESSL